MLKNIAGLYLKRWYFNYVIDIKNEIQSKITKYAVI